MGAPNWARKGRRSSDTRMIAAASARFTLPRAKRKSVTLCLQFRDELFELLDIGRGQRAMFGKMRDQGRQLSLKQSVQQALAFVLHIGGAADQRPVKIAPVVPHAGKSPLAQQAGYQGAHRAVTPVIRLCRGGDDFLR